MLGCPAWLLQYGCTPAWTLVLPFSLPPTTHAGLSSHPHTPPLLSLQVSRWTRLVDIFSKDFLFVPINADKHWSVAIICGLRALDALLSQKDAELRKANKLAPAQHAAPRHAPSSSGDTLCAAGSAARGSSAAHADSDVEVITRDASVSSPCIVFLDSLKCHNQPQTCKELRAWLLREWEARRNNFERLGGLPNKRHTFLESKHMPDFAPDAPEQMNGHDCGVFLLQYVSTWLEKAKAGGPLANGVTLAHRQDRLKGVIAPTTFGRNAVPSLRETMRRVAVRLMEDEQFLVSASVPREDSGMAAVSAAGAGTHQAFVDDALRTIRREVEDRVDKVLSRERDSDGASAYPAERRSGVQGRLSGGRRVASLASVNAAADGSGSPEADDPDLRAAMRASTSDIQPSRPSRSFIPSTIASMADTVASGAMSMCFSVGNALGTLLSPAPAPSTHVPSAQQMAALAAERRAAQAAGNQACSQVVGDTNPPTVRAPECVASSSSYGSSSLPANSMHGAAATSFYSNTAPESIDDEGLPLSAAQPRGSAGMDVVEGAPQVVEDEFLDHEECVLGGGSPMAVEQVSAAAADDDDIEENQQRLPVRGLGGPQRAPSAPPPELTMAAGRSSEALLVCDSDVEVQDESTAPGQQQAPRASSTSRKKKSKRSRYVG